MSVTTELVTLTCEASAASMSALAKAASMTSLLAKASEKVEETGPRLSVSTAEMDRPASVVVGTISTDAVAS